MQINGLVKVRVESPDGDLEGMADECQDFDGRFQLTDLDGEIWLVSGWCCHVEIISEDQ